MTAIYYVFNYISNICINTIEKIYIHKCIYLNILINTLNWLVCYLPPVTWDWLEKTHRNPTKNSQGKAISVISVLCFDSAQCQNHTIEGPPSNETTAICKYVNVKGHWRKGGLESSPRQRDSNFMKELGRELYHKNMFEDYLGGIDVQSFLRYKIESYHKYTKRLTTSCLYSSLFSGRVPLFHYVDKEVSGVKLGSLLEV